MMSHHYGDHATNSPPASIVQVIKFGIVGIAATIIHAVVFLTLSLHHNTTAVIANFTAFGVAFLCSYSGHVFWTFRHARMTAQTFKRFFVVALLGLALNSYIARVISDQWHYSPLIALWVMTISTPVLTFLASQLWVFSGTSFTQPVQLLHSLWRSHATLIYLVMGVLIGTAYALYLFSPAYLNGTADFWAIGDPGAHVASLWAYVNDVWHYPILNTTHINYPDGMNAAFADIIPIAAIPTKLLRTLLPAQFHYFGLWIVLSFALQGLAAVLFYRIVGYRRFPEILIATFIVLLSPALLFRIHAHTALATHGYILLAFCLYYLTVTGAMTYWQRVVSYTTVNSIALLTHPYLLAMVFPVFIASEIDRNRQTKTGLSGGVVLLLSVLPVVVLMLILGYININPTHLTGGGGYGVNSMNLIAPLMGGDFFGTGSQTPGSYPMPMPIDMTGGQSEGYNYLGMGVLLAALITLYTQRTWLLALIIRHPALFCLMVGFTVYAASHIAYIGQVQLWHMPLNEYIGEIANQFRASGRFFWPVGTLITIIALIGVMKIRSRLIAIVLLSVLLVIQWVDTSSLRRFVTEITTYSRLWSITDLHVLENALTDARALHLFPAGPNCGIQDVIHELVPFQRLAALHRVPFNTGLVARGLTDCHRKEQELAQGFQSGHVYVFLRKSYDQQRLQKIIFHFTPADCQTVEFGFICRADHIGNQRRAPL